MSRYLHPASTFLRQCFLASSKNTKFVSLRTQASQWRNHSDAGNGLKFPPRCDYHMHHHSRRHSSNSRAAAISDHDKIREANNEKTPSMIQEAEVTKERSTVISSPLILKQRKEDLTELERDLKQALKRYKSLVDADSNASITDQQRRQSLEAVRIAYEKLSYWDEALATEQAIEEAFVVSQLDQAASLYRQGKLHMRMGAQMEALRHYEKSLALFKQEHVKNAGTSYHADMGNVLISIAGVDFARDRLESSLSILQDSEVHFRYHEQQSLNVDLTKLPSPPHLDLVKCLSHQGLLYRSMGDFSTALSKYREGLQTLEEIIDSSSFAEPKAPNGDDSTDNTAVFLEKREGLHMDIADMLLAMENYDEALEIFQSILDGERKRNRTSLEGIESNSSDCDLGTPLEGVMVSSVVRACIILTLPVCPDTY